MCVTIVNDDSKIAYDAEKSLKDQVCDKSEVLIDYEPDDPSLKLFLEEITKYAKNGTDINLNIKFDCKNYLLAHKLKKEINSTLNDITINKFIKILTLTNVNISKKLEEISSICKSIDLDVR